MNLSPVIICFLKQNMSHRFRIFLSAYVIINLIRVHNISFITKSMMLYNFFAFEYLAIVSERSLRAVFIYLALLFFLDIQRTDFKNLLIIYLHIRNTFCRFISIKMFNFIVISYRFINLTNLIETKRKKDNQFAKFNFTSNLIAC